MKKKENHSTSITIVVLLVSLLLTACFNDHEETGDDTMIVRVGDRIPDFVLSGTDGKVVTPATLGQKTYILNFFDTGCPDCQQELQVLQRIYNKYGEAVPVLNVPRSQTEADVEAYWQQTGLTLPYYMPQDKKLYYQFATSVIPRTYIVDANGEVKAAFSDSPVADFQTLDRIIVDQAFNGVAPSDSVRLTLRLKVPAMRAMNDDYYFQNEYAITYLEVWLFDSETKKFFTKAVATDLVPVEPISSSQYDITYIFDNIRFQAGVYDIFVIANYQHGPDEVTDEEELLNMVDTITYNEGVVASIPDEGAVMTNRATALLGVDFVPWMNKVYVLSVDIERVMAKLQIGVSQNAFQLKHNERKYADVNITNYKLVNLNRQYYLFQHKDNLPEFGSRPEFTLPYHFSDYSDEDNEYIVDPLFYNKTDYAVDANKFGEYYNSWFGNFTTTNFASMPSANNYGYAYILENTAFKTSQRNGYSPGIVYKAAVNPVFVYLYDSKMKTLKEEYRPEYWPNTIYLYNYNFYGSIQAINTASGLSLDELEDYSDAQLKDYGVKQCKFNMGVYETYYTYWIQHRRNLYDHMLPMEYGIVRNNYYKIIVTGISGIGNSVITPDVMRDNHPNSYEDITVSPL